MTRTRTRNKRTTEPATKPTMNSVELGFTGLKSWNGVITEEYARDLQGERGRKIFQRMSTNDTVGACLSAIGLILRAVEWRVEPKDDSNEANAEADFVKSIFDDMSHTREDFLSESLSMLTFGWAYHEIVYKRRVGPYENDPSRKSNYDDGRIGVRKLAPRSQDSLDRWDIQDDGGVAGMWQRAETMTNSVLIPIEKALLFRTMSRKNNPEGVSILRTAYDSWYKLVNIQNIEAIGIERELAGLPVIRIPSSYLSEKADAATIATRQKYEKVARDLRLNEHGGIVIPSDPWMDEDGKFVAGSHLVEIELLSTAGSRTIDTNPIVERYQRGIARSVLADFLMLGSESKGSYALSKDKTDLFLRSCEAVLDQIASPINRFLIPNIWDLNGLPRETMPRLTPGNVAPVNLAELGQFINDLSSSGATLFPDDDLENQLRDTAGLPEKSAEAIAEQDAQREADRKAAEAALNAGSQDDDVDDDE